LIIRDYVSEVSSNYARIIIANVGVSIVSFAHKPSLQRTDIVPTPNAHISATVTYTVCNTIKNTKKVKMDNKEIEKELTELLRLQEYPVAVKFALDDNDFKGVQKSKKDIYSCQMLKIASNGGYVIAAAKERLVCPNERLCFGFEEVQEKNINSQMRYAKTREIAEKQIALRPKTKCIGIICGSLGRARFEPDVLVLTVDAWQATRLIHAYVHETGEDMSFTTGTNAIPCAYGIVYAYETKKPNITLPCSGARSYGKYLSDEMGFNIPWRMVGLFLDGLKATDAKGLKVPLLLDLGYPPKDPMNVFKEE